MSKEAWIGGVLGGAGAALFSEQSAETLGFVTTLGFLGGAGVGFFVWLFFTRHLKS